MIRTIRTASPLLLAMRALRCFNGAAFAALAFFYFGMYCLGAPEIGQIILTPLSQGGI